MNDNKLLIKYNFVSVCYISTHHTLLSSLTNKVCTTIKDNINLLDSQDIQEENDDIPPSETTLDERIGGVRSQQIL